MHRVVLVSDVHYTTQETHEEMKRMNPSVNTSLAAGDIFGYPQHDKVDCMYRDILSFVGREPTDAILFLGDLSLDDYSFRNLPENYCAKLKEECLDRWPVPVRCLAGNHDSYPENMWREVIGTPRQYTAHIGGAAFIMLDTFAKIPATDASGAGYSGVDMSWLRQQTKQCGEGPIFLCAHHIREDEEELFQFMRDDPRIVCAFRGHTHINGALHPVAASEKPLIDIGGYGYHGMQVEKKYIFTRFSPDWAWGYEVLEWDNAHVHMYHVKTPRVYVGDNGTFDYPGCIEDVLNLNIG